MGRRCARFAQRWEAQAARVVSCSGVKAGTATVMALPVRYGRRKLLCIDSASHTPCIPVSMLDLGFKAGWVMNLYVENGVSEHAQH